MIHLQQIPDSLVSLVNTTSSLELLLNMTNAAAIMATQIIATHIITKFLVSLSTTLFLCIKYVNPTFFIFYKNFFIDTPTEGDN